MRRGSLRAAEEMTGHKYETISVWLKRAATHAEALTQVLANDLHLSQVEIDEFWSFVQKKTAPGGTLTRENAGMPGPGSGQSLRRRLREWSVGREPDRASSDHHRRADTSARTALVQ